MEGWKETFSHGESSYDPVLTDRRDSRNRDNDENWTDTQREDTLQGYGKQVKRVKE